MRPIAQEWDKWVTWCERIEVDLRRLVDDAAVFDGVVSLYRGNREWIAERHGNYFFEFVQRCYGARAMLGIRRHVKVDKQAISLKRLMVDVEGAAGQLTLDAYMTRFPDTGVPWQPVMFQKFSRDGLRLSAAVVRDDIDTLERVGASAETIADKTIAHLDANVPAIDLTLEDLAATLDTFNRLACKYLGFVTGDGWVSLESTLQFPWARIFDVPINKAKVQL